ncbi:MAG: hypothetical protein GHCLOJNM_04142 [bacterium]|nr:hypothetical protein [bacterium]
MLGPPPGGVYGEEDNQAPRGSGFGIIDMGVALPILGQFDLGAVLRPFFPFGGFR